MRQLCNATVIRGNGKDVEVVINGIKDKALENERERAHYIEHRRNQLLGSKLGEVKDLFTGQFGIFEKIKEKLIVAWATIWVCGEELGLWAWEEEDR